MHTYILPSQSLTISTVLWQMAKLEACMKKDFREDYLPELTKDGMDTDGEESFQTLITSALLEDDSNM